MVVGATIGLYAARVVKMTQMPELVALMHSLVGLAAVLVGYANYIDPAAAGQFSGAEKTIHEIEIYIGILIGAVTFSGSLIAFGKLSGKISGKPVLLPARHWLNLIGLLLVIWFGWKFINSHAVADGMTPLIVMTVRLAALRHPHGDGDRRCGHARRRVHAEQLLGVGRCRHGFHAFQRSADRDRRSGRILAARFCPTSCAAP